MKKIILLIATFFIDIQCFALPMGEREINHFKEIIIDCCADSLLLDGEVSNNDYYVNLNKGNIKGFNFKIAKVKFCNFDTKRKDTLLDEGITFDKLRNIPIKVAADFSLNEIQAIIDKQISRPATSKRIINEARLSFIDGTINVIGKINMKKIPGNPFALLSLDDFVPFEANFTVQIPDSTVILKIDNGNINGQEMTAEVIEMLQNWLNPLWDFKKLDFPCGVSKFNIHNEGLQIGASLF